MGHVRPSGNQCAMAHGGVVSEKSTTASSSSWSISRCRTAAASMSGISFLSRSATWSQTRRAVRRHASCSIAYRRAVLGAPRSAHAPGPSPTEATSACSRGALHARLNQLLEVVSSNPDPSLPRESHGGEVATNDEVTKGRVRRAVFAAGSLRRQEPCCRGSRRPPPLTLSCLSLPCMRVLTLHTSIGPNRTTKKGVLGPGSSTQGLSGNHYGKTTCTFFCVIVP